MSPLQLIVFAVLVIAFVVWVVISNLQMNDFEQRISNLENPEPDYLKCCGEPEKCGLSPEEPEDKISETIEFATEKPKRKYRKKVRKET